MMVQIVCCPFKPHSSLSEDEGKPPSPLESPVIIPDDAFLMVTQRDWENDILWDVPHSTGPPVTAHGRMRVHEQVQYVLCYFRRCVDYSRWVCYSTPWRNTRDR